MSWSPLRTVDGSPLAYRVRPAAAGAPMLILLHGVGADERSMEQLGHGIDQRFVVLLVRSPIELGPDAYAWFHVRFTPRPVIEPEEARQGWEELARFAPLAAAAHAADPDRIFVAGFSQGGIMATAALLTHPDVFRGAAMLSGRLLPEVLPYIAVDEPRPLLLVHGQGDAKLGIEYAQDARARLDGVLDVEYHELPMGHEVTADAVAVLHGWLARQLEVHA